MLSLVITTLCPNTLVYPPILWFAPQYLDSPKYFSQVYASERGHRVMDNTCYCIVSINLYSASHSVHQSKSSRKSRWNPATPIRLSGPIFFSHGWDVEGVVPLNRFPQNEQMSK